MPAQAKAWIDRYRGKTPHFACVLGFTETGLIEGISAAGATPEDRKYTAIADAEFLVNGVQLNPTHALPPLSVGASPVFISRAIVESLQIPITVFNAGLPQAPAINAIDLGGKPAQCLSTGTAMTIESVNQLFEQGLLWGEKLARTVPESYLIVGECVVGGTTTALATLTALGIAATGKVNSSHSICNHAQKWELVQRGLHQKQLKDPRSIIAAVGDPMQIVVAGMTIAASQRCGVLLAGGTQMLAVYALTRAIAAIEKQTWDSTQVVVGTTRWVAEDATGDTVGLAKAIGDVGLLATSLSFSNSRYGQLRSYEHGYVKEGVGAGGCSIAAQLLNWGQTEWLNAIEHLIHRYQQINSTRRH